MLIIVFVVPMYSHNRHHLSSPYFPMFYICVSIVFHVENLLPTLAMNADTMMPKPSSNYCTSVVTHDTFYGPLSNGTYTIDTIETNCISAPSISSSSHELGYPRLLAIIRPFQRKTLKTYHIDH